MSVLVAGECLGVESREVEHNGNSWIQREVAVLDGLNVVKCDVSKNFAGDLPSRGDVVVMEVSVRAFSFRAGGAGVGYQAVARRSDLEAAFASVLVRD